MDFTLENGSGHPHLYMIGNDAIGLGAIAAGSRFMSAYPITPASEIMEYMIANLPKVDGTVVQTEDEIAAATMAIELTMLAYEALQRVRVQVFNDGIYWIVWYD